MDIYPNPRGTSNGFGTGVKTALLVVVLGTVAALADHAYFVAPHADAQAVGGAPTTVVAPAPASEASTLPADLHPTAADVTPQPPTF